ncbi:MAG: SpoIIE family protein phosphatase [Ignavibacteriae bacterium]|nr:SpoIIE family protein phosphatase [Ignavibacteriota bacterium]
MSTSTAASAPDTAALPCASARIRVVRRAGRAMLFAVVLPVLLYAQDGRLYFERLSVEQGLSQSIVLGVLQDSRGLLWLSTEDGLNLYNGYGFSVMRSEARDGKSLSYNHTTALLEDASRAIWIGTFNGGLNRYSIGKNAFERFRHDPSDNRSIGSDIVHALVQDRDGAMWIGTQNGLDVLPRGARRHFRHVFPTVRADDRAVRALCLDSAGSLWFGGDEGLYRLTVPRDGEAPVDIRPFPLEPARDSRVSPAVRALHVDKAGVLWIGTDDGLFMLRRGGAAVPRRVTAGGLDGHEQVYALLEDVRGTLWIGTNGGGLLALDTERRAALRYRNDPLDRNSLSYDQIRSLYQDRAGILWVGTYGGGVNKVDVRRKAFRHYRRELGNPNSLNENIVWSLYESRDSVLWIGTHGGGLNRYDRAEGRWTQYRARQGDPASISHDVVRLVIGDPSGDLWLGTNGGGLCRFNPRTGRSIRYVHDPADPLSIASNEIRALYLDPRGVLWVGTHGAGICRLDTRAPGPPRFTCYAADPGDSAALSSDFIRFFHEDSNGALWIGTQGGGLTRLDRRSGRFRTWRADPERPGALNNDYVFCMHEEGNGIFWLGTWGGGLQRFDSRRGVFTAFTRRDGLPSDAVYGILPDERGNLWMSTNNGLSRFDPRTRTFKNYTVRDGLQSNEFNGGSFFRSPSGELYFGGINGFNVFRPADIIDNPHVPPVLLTAFRKLNKDVQFQSPLSEITEITLSHEDYVFSFEFAALDFTAPEKNLYAYKMEGLDKDWIAVSAAQRYAQYTTLSPGTYTFRVKGSNNDGVWNERGVSVRIVILPPFWQTWVFRLLVLGLAGLLVLVMYRSHLRRVRLSAELRVAHDTQMAVMPQEDPVLPGFDITGVCRPANEVGGDFFDYFRLGDGNRFGIAVGDVSGKAMRAAMTAVLANGILSAEARAASSPAQALEKANRILNEKSQRGMFTAMCLVALDPAGPAMTFSNAGLVRPLLRRGASLAWLESEGGTLALGLREEHNYTERTLALESGDVVIVVTDGITEAQNASRDFFGDERLHALAARLDCATLSARAIRDAIIEGVMSFTSGAAQYDDMTVVVVKVS